MGILSDTVPNVSTQEPATIVSNRALTIPLIIVFLYMGDVFLTAAHVFSGYVFEHPKMIAMFNLDVEGNLPTWYSSMKLGFIAFGMTLVASRLGLLKNQRVILLWVFSCLFILMSLDEAVQIHERLGGLSDHLLPTGDRKDTSFGITGIWMFVLGIPVAAFCLQLAASSKVCFQYDMTTYHIFIMGLSSLFFGAIAIETMTNYIVLGSNLHTVQICTEELFEMAGATTLFWSILRLMQSNQIILTEPNTEQRCSAIPGLAK